MAFTCEGIILGGSEADPYRCLSPEQNMIVQIYLMMEVLGTDIQGNDLATAMANITEWLAVHDPNIVAAALTAVLANQANDTRSATELWAAAQALKLHCYPIKNMQAAWDVLLCNLFNERQ